MWVKIIRNSIFYIILLLRCFVGADCAYSQTKETNDEQLVSGIKSGDIEIVREIINAFNINYIIKNEKVSPLVLAIRANQPHIVKYLLEQKSDPNLRCQGLTPLMFACQATSNKQISLLLSHGAGVNEIDSIGNTALIYAAITQSTKVAKLLLRHGALLNIRNQEGLMAYDVAIHANNHEVASYLRAIFENHLPDYFDGPYAIYQGKHKIQLTYFKHDSHNGHSFKFTKEYILKKNGLIDGFAGDTASYRIKTKYKPENAVISGVDKMFVIGDVHGQYDTLCKFLINNHIIDKHLKWSFGQGHIIFLGDIFDRGEKVTETLWLIYRLENEAALEGGGVHLILGNHEIMILTNNKHFQSNISDKYYYIFNDLKLDYCKFYNNKTVMGRWLRSKNTILKINDILFVHGGIHPDLLKYNVPIDSVNITINKYLTGKQTHKVHTDFLDFLLSDNGPFWYRHLIPSKNSKESLSKGDVSHILAYNEVNTIMVGHTTLDHVTSYYGGKVFGLDVPFYLIPGKPMQAVYIDLSGYYRVFSGGGREKIK